MPWCNAHLPLRMLHVCSSRQRSATLHMWTAVYSHHERPLQSLPDHPALANHLRPSCRQGHKWYALLSPDSMQDQSLEDGLSVNTAVVRMPVKDLTTSSDNLRVGYPPGNTLLVNVPFPAISDSIAHWAEIMLPTYSVLKSGD